jgi:hypothetical protein
MTRSTATPPLPNHWLSRRRMLRSGGLTAGLAALLTALPNRVVGAEEPHGDPS